MCSWTSRSLPEERLCCEKQGQGKQWQATGGMFISTEGMLRGEMMLLGEVCFSPGHELLQKSKTKFGAMEEPTAQTGSYPGTNVLIPLEDPS